MSMLDMLWVPPIRVLFFFCRGVYKVLFSWWYDPWQQRRANEALWHDVQAKLYFLAANGTLAKAERPTTLPFDYASIEILYKNVRFCLTRGQGELNVTLSPLRFPTDTYHMGWVLAALDPDGSSAECRTDTLEKLAEVLRPRFEAINESFSEVRYPVFREKLLREKELERILIRQSEWELNRRLYENRKRT
jgi:hypothetical protein